MRLEAKNVSFRYREHSPWILREISLSVEKGERDGRTYTQVKELDRRGRQEELARLMGGGSITQAILDSARELMEEKEWL